jgi:hypothetical protein
MAMLDLGERVSGAISATRLSLLILAGLLSLSLLLPATAQPVAAGDRLCFSETGYCAENAFLVFWKTHGAVAILGFPISQPFVDDAGRVVQYYERAILEWHAQHPPAQRVQLALLGADRLGDRPERWAAPEPCGAGCTRFEATDHTLRGAFARFWTAHGGLPTFGYPISEVFAEVSPTDGQTYQVQYFERNRFEYHPERAGSPFEIQLGLLGAEALQGRPDLLRRPAAQVPDYPVIQPGNPVRILIPAIRVDAPVRPVGVDADGAMTAPHGAWETTWYEPGASPVELWNDVMSGILF